MTIAAGLLILSGCMVGPNYKTPSAIMAPSFKETTPASFRSERRVEAGRAQRYQAQG